MKEINQHLLSEIINKNIPVLNGFDDLTILITRNDGVVLWSQDEKAKHNHSLGALISGLWSSAKALTDILMLKILMAS